MLTRRNILIGTLATVAIMRPRTGRASVPAGHAGELRRAGSACGCHAYPRRSREISVLCGAHLHPEIALPEEMAAFHKALPCSA